MTISQLLVIMQKLASTLKDGDYCHGKFQHINFGV